MKDARKCVLFLPLPYLMQRIIHNTVEKKLDGIHMM